MTVTELTGIVRGIAPVLRDYFAAAFAATGLADRVTALEAREVVAQPGERGARGEPGIQGPAGPQGEPGWHGRDGLTGLSGERGMDGKDGKDGDPGRDGTLEGLMMAYDGERTVTFRFKNGDPIEGGVLRLPIPIDRGVYKAEGLYERGDSVTFGGSSFIAQCDHPPGAPETKDSGWRLATKRGRDGKQGLEGQKGVDGKPGRDGRDWGK